MNKLKIILLKKMIFMDCKQTEIASDNFFFKSLKKISRFLTQSSLLKLKQRHNKDTLCCDREV